MDYSLCQTLGNEVTIEYMQGSAELWKLSKANRFSPFIFFPSFLIILRKMAEYTMPWSQDLQG